MEQMQGPNPFQHSDVLFHTPWSPYDPSTKFFYSVPPYVYPHTFGDWRKEALSWKESGYLFAGLNLTPTGFITGPDVIELLRATTTHNYKRFPIGQCKHVAVCDDDGNICMHGLVLRTAEDQVWSSTVFPWIWSAGRDMGFDVEFRPTTYDTFIFQMGGAATLPSLEAASGDDLHDIPFLGFRDTVIAGHKVRILRMTMSGTLGYEVHGDTAHAKEIYEAVLSAGEPYGLMRVGWLTYNSNITENGMPQEITTFITSATEDEYLLEGLRQQGYPVEVWPGHPRLFGSSAEKGIERYYRNPIELGWGVSVQDGHDFRGKEALLALKANPTRKTMTLVWNPEDVLDIMASYYRKDGEPYKWINYPCHTYFSAGLEQDEVFDMQGNNIGVSANVQYTEYSRDLLSLGTLDVDSCVEGTEVQVLWGDPGTPQKLVRATVARYPYLDLPTNMAFDVETIPHVNQK